MHKGLFEDLAPCASVDKNKTNTLGYPIDYKSEVEG
jgi:hypothetical protein